MNPIAVACDTCRVPGCRKYDLFCRDAIYAWLLDVEAECGDYLPRWSRGVEGVHESDMDSVYDRSIFGRNIGDGNHGCSQYVK